MPAGQKYWIEENSLSAEILNVDLDRDGEFDHSCFTIRNQCLHAKHPLGWMRKMNIFVDGKEIPQDKAYFVIRGQWICLKHLPTITDIWWNVAEEAQIYFETRGGLKRGAHRVQCRIEMSLHVNTRTVDLQDFWPRLIISLDEKLKVL